MKVAIYTLGCKVNQYETQAIEQTLRARGHEVVPFTEEADAYVINSCSVTAVSDQKSRQMLHRVRRQHPDAVAALCGCYPQTHAEDVRALDVDLIAGTGDRIGFVELLEEAAEKKGRIEAIDQSFERRVFEVLPAGGLEERTRAMLKVEDGCVLLHLLHHPLCPGTGAVPAPHGGGPPGRGAAGGGLPGDRAHRH